MRSIFASSICLALVYSFLFTYSGTQASPPGQLKVDSSSPVASGAAEILQANGNPGFFLVMLDPRTGKRVESWIYPGLGKKFLLENGKSLKMDKFKSSKEKYKSTPLSPAAVSAALTPAMAMKIYGVPSKTERSGLGTRHQMTVLRYFPPRDTKSFCFIDNKLTCVTAGFAYDPKVESVTPGNKPRSQGRPPIYK